MNESVSPELHDLSDKDMVSRRQESPPSLIAATGIDFEGLERIDPIPMQQWIAARRASRKTDD